MSRDPVISRDATMSLGVGKHDRIHAERSAFWRVAAALGILILLLAALPRFTRPVETIRAEAAVAPASVATPLALDPLPGDEIEAIFSPAREPDSDVRPLCVELMYRD